MLSKEGNTDSESVYNKQGREDLGCQVDGSGRK